MLSNRLICLITVVCYKIRQLDVCVFYINIPSVHCPYIFITNINI